MFIHSLSVGTGSVYPFGIFKLFLHSIIKKRAACQMNITMFQTTIAAVLKSTAILCKYIFIFVTDVKENIDI